MMEKCIYICDVRKNRKKKIRQTEKRSSAAKEDMVGDAKTYTKKRINWVCANVLSGVLHVQKLPVHALFVPYSLPRRMPLITLPRPRCYRISPP